MIWRTSAPSLRMAFADATNIFESNAFAGGIYANSHIARRHSAGSNILFLDIHVNYFKDSAVSFFRQRAGYHKYFLASINLSSITTNIINLSQSGGKV